MRHSKSQCLMILIVFAVVCHFGLPKILNAESPKRNENLNKPPSALKGSPSIQFDELSYDFGKSFQHKILEHVFAFRNVGKTNLHIIKVKAG